MPSYPRHHALGMLAADDSVLSFHSLKRSDAPTTRARRASSATSNCALSNSRRHRRSRSTSSGLFFVEDSSPVPVLAVEEPRRATTTVASSRGRTIDALRFAAPVTQRRPKKSAMKSATQSTRKRKMVGFKNAYTPDIIPDSQLATLQSYDELFFNVAGLYHTLSYMHDPDFLAPDESDSATDSSSTDSNHEPMMLERSVQLMIAEFLYRSAVYLGYPPDDHVWVPGFREKKRFSSNDVRRWRRLAHLNWDAEEEAFQMELAKATQEVEPVKSSQRGLRAAVSNWLTRKKDHTPAPTRQRAISRATRPPLVETPPPISRSADLTALVAIANQCISYGSFRFSAKDIRKLCNVPIKP